MSNDKKVVVVPASGQVPATEVDVNSVLQEAKKTGDLSEAKFFALLNVLLAKEARLAEKEAALESAIQSREEQRRRECQQYTIEKMENQKNCRHLKGGRGRARGQQRDPSVYQHTFTDGSVVIKCTLCGAKWMPKDTREYVMRDGRAIPNWTGISWQDACEMVDDSSNKSSASEQFGSQRPDTTKAKQVLDIGSVQI
jgi:hypothetical protein